MRGCLGVLETCVRANFAAVESSRWALITHTYEPVFDFTLYLRLYSEVSMNRRISVSFQLIFLSRHFSAPKISLNVSCLLEYFEYLLISGSLDVAYFDELEASLKFIRETPELSIDEKKRFFKSANTNLGTFSLKVKYVYAIN